MATSTRCRVIIEGGDRGAATIARDAAMDYRYSLIAADHERRWILRLFTRCEILRPA